MEIKVFQFHGCNKCFNESILLKENPDLKIEFVQNPDDWKESKFNISVITGYLLPEDKSVLEKIAKNSERIIAYGNCSGTGGVYALANQRGHDVSPLKKMIIDSENINGCLAEVDELKKVILGEELPKLSGLCKVCKRKATCDYLDEVHRQLELDDEETCFNDLGFLCNGFIARECKERCIDYNTPCRGCKYAIDRPGIRMLGMFGTLMGNIEVATEHSVKGATDKLADANDDVTASLPDILGNFFRFTLSTSGLPRGRIESKGSLVEDALTGRLIEELPLIFGLIGGNHSIKLSLKVIETYEKANGIEVSEQTQKYRSELLKLEDKLQEAIEDKDPKKYREITSKIRKIAGNMNISNVYFGGFKSIIVDNDNFEDYKTHVFEVVEGTYRNGSVEYSIDSDGIITEIKIKE